MNKIIDLLKTYLLIFIVLFIYLILMSIFSHFEVFNYNTVSIINYIFMMLLFFVLGFKYSSKIKKKGYLNGFISSAVLVILFCLFSLIITKLDLSSLIYYLTLILSSITGGIISTYKN